MAAPNLAAPSSSIALDLSEMVCKRVSDLSAAHIALAETVVREL